MGVLSVHVLGSASYGGRGGCGLGGVSVSVSFGCGLYGVWPVSLTLFVVGLVVVVSGVAVALQVESRFLCVVCGGGCWYGWCCGHARVVVVRCVVCSCGVCSVVPCSSAGVG